MILALLEMEAGGQVLQHLVPDIGGCVDPDLVAANQAAGLLKLADKPGPAIAFERNFLAAADAFQMFDELEPVELCNNARAAASCWA